MTDLLTYYPHWMTPFEKRSQLIRLRIEGFERGRKVLGPDDKWPTVKSVRQYQERKAKQLPEEAEASPKTPPTIRDGQKPVSFEASSNTTRATTSSVPNLPEFPFPISNHKDLSSFVQFPALPTEIRLLIWEFALLVPKFIEVQFCTEFYAPTFVNCRRHEALHNVCQESREVATALTTRVTALPLPRLAMRLRNIRR
jgi:hypothetical protein